MRLWFPIALAGLLAACADSGVTPRDGDGGLDGGASGDDAGRGGDGGRSDAGRGGGDGSVERDAGPGDAGPPPGCTPGGMMPCTSSCGSAGERRCAGGAFGPCVPPAEICNGADDDCDGAPDQIFECPRGGTGACTTSCGSTGSRACSAACTWGLCAPPIEACNGTDDDCDGATDEGALCPARESCVAGRCETSEWVFEAEGGASGHRIGRAEADGWSANTAADPEGYLVFGPYTPAIPAGTYNAIFRMMIDNNSADDAIVVRLEVNDFDGGPGMCGACNIAQRSVTRREFTGTFTYQDFVVRFTSPGAARRLEFRTYWMDRAYIRQDRVTVRRAP